VQVSDAITASKFYRYFDQNVAGDRASTADASPPFFFICAPCCQMLAFRSPTTTDIIAAVRALPDKQCASDPLRTRLLKESIIELASFLTELFCNSLPIGKVLP
jgi:hypothetical protein